MTSPSALEAGRSAAADRRWADAYELLAGVDATEGLAASDLELLATAALLRGEPTASVDAWSRAYQAHLAVADTAGAAHTAGMLALLLIELGDFTGCVLWSARAMRLTTTMVDPGALAGFVRMAAAIAQLGGGDPGEARRQFEEILVIAERDGDPELIALTMLGLGKSLIEVDAVGAGFACFDRAMAAVEAGDLSTLSVGVVSCALISTR